LVNARGARKGEEMHTCRPWEGCGGGGARVFGFLCVWGMPTMACRRVRGVRPTVGLVVRSLRCAS
jgi:hypothetical protein